MATKYYGIKDNWTDDDVANVIEVASEDGSVSSVKVNGVEYGGGGGGDFSTCTLTVINNIVNEEWPVLNAPALQYVEPGLDPELYYLGSDDIPYDEGSNTFEVVLYKGAACVRFTGGGDVGIVWSGNHSNDTLSHITGDTTVTLTDA